MFDLLIRGGMLIDGSGSRRRRSDVGVREGRVAGFVDIHTHSDFTILSDPRASNSGRDPHQFPAGIEEVIVAGRRVIAAGEQRDDERPGRVVRHAATTA